MLKNRGLITFIIVLAVGFIGIFIFLGFYYRYDRYKDPNNPNDRLMLFNRLFFNPVYKIYCSASGGRIVYHMAGINCARRASDVGKECRDSKECEVFCQCDKACQTKAISSQFINPITKLIKAEFDNPVVGKCYEWSDYGSRCEVNDGRFFGACSIE